MVATFPRMLGSPPSRFRQNLFPTITTSFNKPPRSSSYVKSRPITGDTPKVRKKPAVTRLADTFSGSPTPAPVQRTLVDTKAIRREVRAIHRGRGGSLDTLLQQARAFLAAGDGRNALALLEALTDETVAEESFESWEGREDWEDEPTGFFEELGPLWVEALLTAELTTTERAAWADRSFIDSPGTSTSIESGPQVRMISRFRR